MGNVIHDRFFWALPPEDEEEEGAEAATEGTTDEGQVPSTRHIH